MTKYFPKTIPRGREQKYRLIFNTDKNYQLLINYSYCIGPCRSTLNTISKQLGLKVQNISDDEVEKVLSKIKQQQQQFQKKVKLVSQETQEQKIARLEEKKQAIKKYEKMKPRSTCQLLKRPSQNQNSNVNMRKAFENDYLKGRVIRNLVQKLYQIIYNRSQFMINQDSDDDQWATRIEAQTQVSMFNKISMKFDDEIIKNNIEKQCSKPILYYDDPQELQQEDFCEKPQTTAQQALYDPLEDDDNQQWVSKKFKNSHKTKIKPLSCPGCFCNISYSYIAISNTNPLQYKALKVQNIIVDETKIIRNSKELPKLEWSELSFLHPSEAEKQFKFHEENFNIKIVCFCSCGLEIGLYDINNEEYLLFNVI